MLEILERAERELPALLADDARWQSLDIDYHEPYVERLWTGWGGDYRISLHRIHPCEPSGALFHPHPWPSAMRILDGTYEMAIGYGTGDIAPPIASRLIVTGGDFRYEMTDPDAWHYVRPIGAPAMTIMVTGRPWTRASPSSSEPLRPLDAARRATLFAYFRARYS